MRKRSLRGILRLSPNFSYEAIAFFLSMIDNHLCADRRKTPTTFSKLLSGRVNRMNKTFQVTFFFLAITAGAVTLFAQNQESAANAKWDPYAELPANLNQDASAREMHIHSAAEADAVRRNVINYMWGGSGLPTDKLPTSTTVYTGKGELPADLVGLDAANIASADRLQAKMDFDYSTAMYLLHPVNTKNARRLAVVHHGHTGYGDRFGLGVGSLTDHLLKNGFTVLAMQMPLNGWNIKQNKFHNVPGQPNPVILNNHNKVVSTLEGKGGSGIRFFLEPVIQGINKFIAVTPDYQDISMFGLSGGGWTTALVSAIDARIKLSIPVAGSSPLYVRAVYHYSDDLEQNLPAMYVKQASYLDLYALGGYGAGRRQIQLNNQYDACCFYGNPHQTYEKRVKNAVASTGVGQWDFYLDTTHRAHQISPNAIFNVIDPALGLVPIAAPLPSIAEEFNDAGTPPPGWRYDPFNGGSPTITSGGGEVRFQGGKDVVSIVNKSVFNPQGRITASMTINSLGAGGCVGIFLTSTPEFRDRQLGLQISADGRLLLNADHGAGFGSGDLIELTKLNDYKGGPITLNLTWDAEGFTASTDVGNFSKHLTFPLANEFTLGDLGPEAYLFIQNFSADGGNATVDGVKLQQGDKSQ
jgi:hypothetical protein